MDRSKNKHIVFSVLVGGSILVGLILLMKETSQRVYAAPNQLFIKPDMTGDCSQSNPCDLQTALGQAVDGDTLYLAGGTYTGAGGAVITVTKSITIYGGWNGSATTPVMRDPDTYVTTLNGQDARRVVYISGSITPKLEGLVIVDGKDFDGSGVFIENASPIIQYNYITANRTITGGFYEDGRGGGISVSGSSNAVIAHNRIINNRSGYGAGIYHEGNTAITIIGNRIEDNLAYHRAGGIMIENSPDIVQANTISGNNAGVDGGGIVIWDAAPQVEANHITGNIAIAGGGISMGNNATPSLINNLIISNTHDAINVESSSPVIVNNTIVGNGLIDSGDGIRLWSNVTCTSPYCTTGNIINNIIVHHEVGISGTGVITPTVDYNDIWGNTLTDYQLPGGVVTGTHNLSLDPIFVNLVNEDYHLKNNSPCVNAGDPAGVPPAPPTDIDGLPRPTDGRVDIGADEFQVFHILLPAVLNQYTP